MQEGVLGCVTVEQHMFVRHRKGLADEDRWKPSLLRPLSHPGLAHSEVVRGEWVLLAQMSKIQPRKVKEHAYLMA